MPQDIMGLQEAYNTIYLQEDAEQLDELIAPLIGAGLGYLGAKAGKGFVQGLRGDGNKPVAPTQSRFAGARDAAFNKAQAIKGSPVVGAKPTPTTTAKPGTPPAPAKPVPGAAAKPAPTAPAKPAPTTSTTPAAKPSAMDQFRKANPRLAAAADEKARIRGTSQTDNPLMKDMRSKMPMTPSVQSPTLAKDLGSGGGNQSLINNPNASKAAPPKPAPTASTPPKKPVVAHFDLFDVVLGHLLDEGYADTEEAALAIMANMSEEWKQSILEG